MQKRGMESLLDDVISLSSREDVISLSSRESDNDSEHEPVAGDRIDAESSDATRPSKKQREVSVTAP